MEKIMGFFRSIKYGIRNLLIWFSVIWNDRDWDQWFLYKILQFKLKRMEKLQRKYGNSTNSEKYADQIKLAVLLLQRLIDDNYLQNVLKPHEEKWGESEMIFTPIDPTEGDEGFSTLDFKVENANTEEEKEQEHKERMILYKHSDALKQQDLDLLFKHMRKYIECWWD
jgi:hypothetical protein